MDKIEKIKEWVQKQTELYWEKLPDADDEHPTEIQLRDLGQYMAYENMESSLDTLSEQPDKSLEEAAEISFDEAYALTEDYRDFLAKGLTENRPRPIGPHWFCEYAKKRFLEGAEWQKEQMLKDAVEGRVFMSFAPGHNQMVMADVDLPTNTEVRVIVLKAEE